MKHVGNLEITKENQAQYANLTEVTGYLSIYSNCTFNALTSVGGDLYIYSNCTLNALTSVGGDLHISSNCTLNALFTKDKELLSIDGYGYLVKSRKNVKGIEVLSGGNVKKVIDNIPTLDGTFVARKDGFSAHGETVKKAIEDLEFKIISEQLKNNPINEDTVLDIKYYRLITGSCESGVKSWMEQHNIKEPITAKELLPILERTNAYGVEKFKSLITF